MKILKNGKYISRKFVCPTCGCEFETDGREHVVHIVDGVKFYFATCPWCYQEVQNYD